MSLRKRGDIWWIGFTAPSGQRIRQSTGTSDRQAAQEYHDQLKAQLWSQAKLGQKPMRLFDELATLWLKKKQEKRSIAEDAYKITFYRRNFGGRPLQQITRQAIEGCLEQFENPCTYNRYMQLMRSIFRMAREEGWIEAIPAFRLRREPKRRVRWLKPQEAIRLIEELPERHRPEARFALATGLRKGNIINLEWSQVDMVAGIAWIHPDQSKSGNAIPVPLNSDAREIIRGQIGKHERLVFAGWRGISQDVWKGALKRPESSGCAGMISGIPGLRGTCKAGPISMSCWSWVAGRVSRWFASTPTLAKGIWLSMPSASPCWAQNWHRGLPQALQLSATKSAKCRWRKSVGVEPTEDRLTALARFEV